MRAITCLEISASELALTPPRAQAHVPGMFTSGWVSTERNVAKTASADLIRSIEHACGGVVEREGRAKGDLSQPAAEQVCERRRLPLHAVDLKRQRVLVRVEQDLHYVTVRDLDGAPVRVLPGAAEALSAESPTPEGVGVSVAHHPTVHTASPKDPKFPSDLTGREGLLSNPRTPATK